MPVAALDVGAKRIGVAISDPGETFAMPLMVLERTNVEADLTRIDSLLREHGAREVVVGDPLTLAGERGIAAEHMDRFVERLSRVFDGQVHRMDERLTTAQAQRSLIGADVSRGKRKQVVDKLAAALILDTFLSRRKRQRDANG